MENKEVQKQENNSEECNPVNPLNKHLEKVKNNPWMASTIVLAIVSLILLLSSFSGGVITGGVISEVDASEMLLDFYTTSGAQGLEIGSVEELSGVYQVNFLYNGQAVPMFVTKDGKLAGQLTPLSAPEVPAQQPTTTTIPKTDKPKAELFIMTHCPYGTQAEKGFLPMMRLMENIADVKIRFVHYFMHDPEETETPRQVCIREEQSDKYLDYLECFLGEGDSEGCLVNAAIDQVSMNNCIDNGNAEKYYKEDSVLSETYGVQGSPTLIINGVKSNAGRDAASYLDGLCKAYTDSSVPVQCGEKLSDAAPTPMWGWDGSGSNSDAQC